MFKDYINDDLLQVVFSNKIKTAKYNKAKINQKLIKGSLNFQIELYTDKQVFHQNIKSDELNDKMNELFLDFNQIEIFTNKFVYGFKRTSKGKILNNKRENTSIKPKSVEHNKQKKIHS